MFPGIFGINLPEVLFGAKTQMIVYHCEGTLQLFEKVPINR
jgi:hypothetical protein